jgi:peptidoglycan/LPS O-acetylase OafA/YrhL
MIANQNKIAQSKYRPDIDGLRAIAVLAVVAYHAFPVWVKGGFIGVDIFFVISGFLISTMIFENLDGESFSLFEFYVRRIKRIFPALIFVLVTCFSFGWFALLADEFQQLGKHIVASAMFVSNIVLWSEAGYFDNSSETKPLLHLWSLGIEEQFYIIWPLLLWFSWKRKFIPLAITTLMAIISFALNIQGVSQDAVATFYLPQTRFWELLSGSLLAWFNLFKKEIFFKSINKINSLSRFKIYKVDAGVMSNVFSFVGLSLLAYGFLQINKELNFPGIWALIPVLGAVIVIAAGPEAWVNHKILSNGVLVWFGLISFPLYLWHWPILSFAHILVGDVPTWLVRVGVIICSILLAWGTYNYIEIPIRYKNNNNSAIVLLVLLMIFVGGIGFYINKKEGMVVRYKPTINDYSIRAAKIVGDGVIDCSEIVRSTKSAYCAKTSQNPYVGLFGDSHARHLFYGFAQIDNSPFNRLIYIGASACQPTLNVEHREGCDNNLLTAIDVIQTTPSIEYVVLSSWNFYIESADADLRMKMIEGYRKTINLIKKANKKIVFVIDTPSLKSNPEICVEPPLPVRAVFKRMPYFCNGAAEADMVSHVEYNKAIQSLRAEHPDIFFYDPYNIFCSDGKCKVFDGLKILYQDDHHLSIYGSKYLVNSLVKDLESLKR